MPITIPSPYVVGFADISLTDVASVGGKNASPGELFRFAQAKNRARLVAADAVRDRGRGDVVSLMAILDAEAVPHATSATELGVSGYTFGDLHDPERLASLYERFCEEVETVDPELWHDWDGLSLDGGRAASADCRIESARRDGRPRQPLRRAPLPGAAERRRIDDCGARVRTPSFASKWTSSADACCRT